MAMYMPSFRQSEEIDEISSLDETFNPNGNNDFPFLMLNEMMSCSKCNKNLVMESLPTMEFKRLLTTPVIFLNKQKAIHFDCNSNLSQDHVVIDIPGTSSAVQPIVHETKPDTCSICLAENEDRGKRKKSQFPWIILECTHQFHLKCMNEWFKTKNHGHPFYDFPIQCPICRFNTIYHLNPPNRWWINNRDIMKGMIVLFMKFAIIICVFTIILKVHHHHHEN